MRSGLKALDRLLKTRWCGSLSSDENRLIVGDSDRKRCQLKSREFSFKIKSVRFDGLRFGLR
jgi:hypothetical protein